MNILEIGPGGNKWRFSIECFHQGDNPESPTRHTSEWASYLTLAKIEIHGHTYVMFSGYWEGTFPIETVLEFYLSPVPTKIIDNSMEKPE